MKQENKAIIREALKRIEKRRKISRWKRKAKEKKERKQDEAKKENLYL